VERPPARGDKAPHYQTFLLTCWQEEDEVAGTVTWRFKLETPRSGSRRLFGTLKEALEIIEKELKGHAQSED
jgi:hypothetical protein